MFNNKKCYICNKIFNHPLEVMNHVKKIHNLNRKEYLIKVIYNGIKPTCKCGCGQETNYYRSYPYFREYINGHNKNPMTGKHHSDSSKKKMSCIAKKRIDTLKKENITLPMHSSDAIIKRSKSYSDNLMQKKQIQFNVEFINSYDERQSGIYKFRCKKCNSEYVQNHNSYFICSKCFPKIKSKCENEIFEFIHDELKMECIKNSRSIIDNLEIDIFIPSFNLAIEFNGLFWHSEIHGHKNKKYHLTKTIKCLEKNITLIQIFEDEWFHNKELIKSKLKHLFKLNIHNKIYAKKCTIKTITSKEKNIFLTYNHIQGKDNSTIHLGCFYKNVLVSVMTFGKERRALGTKSNDNTSFELIRFASDINYTIVGTAGKLLKYFINNYNVTKIISYADRRWSTGNLYNKLNFVKISDGTPNYWYTTFNFNRLHRFGFTKQKLIKLGYDPSKTEWEIMQAIGYDRVWDCGHLKYELKV